MPTPQKKNLSRWVIRLCGSAGMLAVLFWLLPLDAFANALTSVTLSGFLIVFAAFLATHVVASAKWWWLLHRAPPFRSAVRAHFAGLAGNLCLPGSVGGDAVRAMLVYRDVQDGARVVAASTLDRMIDLAALGLLVVIGLTFARSDGADTVSAGVALAALAGGLFLLLWIPGRLPRLWGLFPKLPGRKLADKLAEACAEYKDRSGLIIAALCLSVIIQGTLVLLSWWLALQAGLDVGLWPWVFAWPLAKILSVLPISLGGLGLREGVLAALLIPFGSAVAVVVAAGLMWQAVLFSTGALGGIVYFMTSDSGERVPQ